VEYNTNLSLKGGITMVKRAAATKKTQERKPRSKIDNDELRKMLEEGKSAKEIMSVFKLTGPSALRNKVLQLSINDAKVYTIPGLFGRRDSDLTAGKLGIRIPPNRIDKKFRDHKFSIETNKENGTIVLTPVKEEEA
jgi:hypothetical protein